MNLHACRTASTRRATSCCLLLGYMISNLSGIGICAEGTTPAAETTAPNTVEATAVEPSTAVDPSADAAASEFDRKLGEITTKMTQVTEQLGDRRTGQETQALQQQILAALDELLKSPPQQSPLSSGGSGGGESSKSSSNSSPPAASSQSSASQGKESSSAANDSKKQGMSGDKQDREGAEDSEERTGKRQDATIPVLPRQRMEVDVWGHLPENIRDQLLNSYGERMLPEYADLVQRFYQSLAETGSSRNNRGSESPDRNR